MSKIFKSIARISPIALPFIAPGIGTALGAGLGLTGTAASTVGGGLIGAGLGAASGGGLKGALLGGATGGLGGALSSPSGLNLGGLGTSAGTPLSGGLQGATQGSGILGSATRATSGITSALKNAIGGLSGSGSSGGLLNSFGGIGNVVSGINNYMTQSDMEDQLLKAQGRAQQQIAPFTQAGQQATNQLSSRLTQGFNPGDLTNDPGYQFRLREGQSALERSLAARGLGQSGAALKAAQEYGQGLADQTYNDAYSRWLQQNSQLSGLSGTGLNSAMASGQLEGVRGDIRANALASKSNILTQALTGNPVEPLRASGSQRIIGYDEFRRPIYG